jgi:hypothetical protein
VLPSLAQTARFGSLVTSAVALVVCSAPRVEAADAVQHLIIRAELQPATALRVSSHVLVFDVAAEDGTAVAMLDYVASARVSRDGEVILSVQTTRGEDEPGGSARSQRTLTIGNGAALPPDTPVIAQRWMGGGTRSGTLVFTLQAATAGRYVVPVRVALLSP